MKIYQQEIKFPQPTYARIIGGHPEGSLVLTQGVVIDTLDDSIEPYYDCLIIGNTAAVYPYTASRRRILSQSQLASLSRLDGAAIKDYVRRNENGLSALDAKRQLSPTKEQSADLTIPDAVTPAGYLIRKLFTRVIF